MTFSLPRIASVTVMLIGAAVLLGWSFGITALTSLSPEWVPMRPSTTLAFILAGLSLWLTSGSRGAGPRARLSAGACAGLVATIGALTLGEYLLGWHLGIDRWLFAAIQAADNADPGRMSYASAISFLMVGATMILLNRRSFLAGWLIQLFILLISTIAGLGLLRYIPGVELVSSITFNGTMAFHTTAGFLLLCFGTYRAQRDRAGEYAKPDMVARSEGGPKRRAQHAWIDVVMIALVAVTLGIAAVSFHYVESRLIQEAGEGLAVTAANVADKLDRILYERDGDIHLLAQMSVFKGGDRAAISKLLVTMKETYHYYAWLGMVDAQGRIVASTNAANLGEDRSQRDWFKAVRDHGGIHVREAQYSEDAGDMMAVGFTAPILGLRGEFLGAVTTRVSLPVMEQVFAETVRMVERQEAFSTVEYQLLNRDGDLLIDSRLRQEGQVNLKRLAQPSALLSGGGEPGYIEERHLRRSLPVVTGYASCKGYGNFAGLQWSILTQMDRSDILTKIEEVLQKLSMAGAMVLVPLLGFVFWSTRRLKTEWAIAQEETAHAMAAEAAAQASKEQFRSVTQSANDAIISSDSGGTILSWNKGAYSIFGYEEDEVFGKPLTLLMPQRYRVAHGLGLEQVSGTGERSVVGTTVELQGLRKDGSEFPLELSSSEWKSEGKMFYSSIIRDVTERKRAEEELCESETRLQAILDNSPGMVFMKDVEGRYLHVNRQFASTFHMTREQVVGRTDEAICGTEQAAAFRANDLKVLQAGVPLEFEEINMHDDGPHTSIVSKFPLYGGDGKLYALCGITTDITERKKLVDTLQINEERLRLIARAAKDLLWDWDVAGNLLWWNESLQTALGYRAEEIEPGIESWENRIHPDDKAKVLSSIHTVIDSGQNDWSGEYRFRRADGSYSYFLDRGYVLHRNEEGKPLRMLGSMVDISERKRMEGELRQNEIHFRTLIENVQDIITILNLDGTITYESPSVEQVLGYKPEEMVGRNVLEFIHKEDQRCIIEALKKIVYSQSILDIQEFRFQSKDGSWRNLECIGKSYANRSGNLLLLLTSRDVTKRKLAENLLLQTQEQLQLTIEAGNAGLWSWNPQNNDTYLSPAWKEQLGYAADEIPNRMEEFEHRLHPGDHDRVMQGITAFLKNRLPKYENEFRLRHKDGSYRWIFSRAGLFDDEKNQTTWFTGCNIDITERKLVEAELQIAKVAAESANRAKSEFLASMSHEIRTPMNAIVGMAELLAETPLSDEQSQYVQTFRKAGDNLLNLINDILDLSKVEAGHMDLEAIDFNLYEVVEKACEMIAPRAHEKGLELINHVWPAVPDELVGDPTRLRQILLNLLGNAVKFTERGEVGLHVTKDPDARDPGTLQFSVSDSGIGIPPDKLDTIFKPFTQVDASTTRRYGGSGLGLGISRRLVELMGGRIWIESCLGQGTTVHFTLPIRVGSVPHRRVASREVDLQDVKTLVVDDNATNRLALHEMLSDWHALVTEAGGGEAALAQLRRAQDAGEPFRLVLLDGRMPGMDGSQVAEAVQRQPDLRNVKMIMLTSDGRGGDRARAKKLGFARYLMKPVKRIELLNAISDILTAPLPALPAGQDSTQPLAASTGALAYSEAMSPLSILLAEDMSDNQLLIQAYLKRTPYRLDIAENGDIARAKFKGGHYDLVLMDMQMPVMDGYDATRAIRQWEQEQGRPPTPIIALTAHALKGDEQKSLDAGCTAHLTKPIKKLTLLAAIVEYSRSPVT